MTSAITISRVWYGLLLIWAAGTIANKAPELSPHPGDGVDWIAVALAVAYLAASTFAIVAGVYQFVGGLWAWGRGR